MMLRGAVIGVGYLGRFHAQKYKLIDEVKLVGVCDIRQEQAKKVADELSVPHFSNYQELKGQIDIATVASTTNTHFEICKWLLENDISVLVEKPMCVNSEEAGELCRIAEEKNLVLQVGHIERFNSIFNWSKNFFKKPKFLDAQRLHRFTSRGADVNVILDLMIHDLDIILSMCDSPIKSVTANGLAVVTDEVDVASCRIEFEDGVTANLLASRCSNETTRKIRIFEDGKYISVDIARGLINLTEGSAQKHNESISVEKEDALLLETRYFVDAVLKKQAPVVSGNDGRRVLLLAEEIIKQIHDRR